EKDVFHERLSPKINFHPNKNSNYLSLRKLRSLLKLIKSHDVIHVHLFPPFYIVAFLSFFVKNKTFVYTEHNTFNFRRKKIFKGMEWLVYSRYDHVVCISEGTKQALTSWMGKSVRSNVINNAINLKEIAQAKALSKIDLNIPEDCIALCMVGRFQEQKDQDTLIKALELLPEKYVLLLLGEGERESLLRKHVETAGLVDRVRFLGIRNDVYRVLKACDYGVLSSHWEGFGIVALEYMACGILALGSDLEGLKEVIGKESCLFQPQDHKDLAGRILDFESNLLEYEDSKNWQQQHLQNFDIANAVKRHFEVYRLKNN
ncbi:MAG: glycosyltransferase, partial [Bacteroidota bacterium]